MKAKLPASPVPLPDRRAVGCFDSWPVAYFTDIHHLHDVIGQAADTKISQRQGRVNFCGIASPDQHFLALEDPSRSPELTEVVSEDPVHEGVIETGFSPPEAFFQQPQFFWRFFVHEGATFNIGSL